MRVFFQLVILLCIGASCVHAQIQAVFLELDGIVGSSSESNHFGWIEVDSIAQGVSRVTDSVCFDEFAFSKAMDEASPQLALHVANGAVIPLGRLDLVRVDSGLVRFLRVQLSDILVTSYSVSGGNGHAPEEKFSIRPSVVSWKQTSYDKGTGLPRQYTFHDWNVQLNSATAGTFEPAFVFSGITKGDGIELSWTAEAGRRYRVFAVSSLTAPFIPLAEVTAVESGMFSYGLTSTSTAMFYTVETVSDGF